MTANTFGIAVCTTSAVIFEVCNVIGKYLGLRFVYLPKNKQQMIEKISEFESKFGMIQTFGCIDATHHQHLPLFVQLITLRIIFVTKAAFWMRILLNVFYDAYFY